MEWTTDVPTAEGNYLWRAGPFQKKPDPMHIYEVRGQCFAYDTLSSGLGYMVEALGGEWSGPIVPPKESE